jgi:hypothetical protein
MAVNPRELAAYMASQGLTPGQQVRIPSETEKAEMVKVRNMQVRTQAAALVCQLLAQRQTSQNVWDRWAEHIETYILEGRSGDTAPVRPRS